MKHTPTPWKRDGIQIVSADGKRIASVVKKESLDGWIKRENMDFIVRAVNAHDDLLAALEEQICGAKWRKENEPKNWNGCDDEALERAEEAVAKAKVRK